MSEHLMASDACECTDMAVNSVNLSLLDPAKWGWSAGGGIVDLQTPNERSKRKSTKKPSHQSKAGRKRGRREAFFPGRSDTAKSLKQSLVNGQEISKIDNSPTSESSIHIPKVQESNQNQNDNLSFFARKSRSKSLNPNRFKALQSDGKSLDIDCYYCGNEKFDQLSLPIYDAARNENYATDNLQCTDSQPKSLIAQITVQFPVESTDLEIAEFAVSKRSETLEEEFHYYRDTIQWDLADVNNPTPTLFASRMAEEYGLSFFQTMELAQSIQQQLKCFIEQNCTHVTPIAWRGILSSSPSQHVLDYKPTPLVPHLYGEVMEGNDFEGSCRPLNQKSKLQKAVRSCPSISSLHSDLNAAQKGKDRPNPELGNSLPRIKGGKHIVKRSASRSSEKTADEADIYYLEIQRRLHSAMNRDDKYKASSNILIRENFRCHLCRKLRPSCYVFPCNAGNHAYCSKHFKEKLQQNNQEQSEFCPVCTLSCDCRECTRVLNSVVVDFKRKCLTQSTTPEATVYPDLLTRCISVSMGLEGNSSTTQEGRSSKGKPKHHSSCQKEVGVSQINKISMSKFPREVTEGVDLDHLYGSDYNLVFGTASLALENATLINISSGITVDRQEAVSNSPIIECNSDYCHICATGGYLICCDFCPRSYHSQCLPADEHNIINDTSKWECYICRHENQNACDDMVTGDIHYATICAAFSDAVDQLNDTNAFGPRLLSLLLDMVHHLVHYDFGYMFQSPVDTQQVKTYTSIVKKPMDLGTISLKLEKGLYKECVTSRESCFDEVALAVLQDVELVWHNCFLFNCEGSAIYRMAEVQRKRANTIRTVSFDQYLSEFVKENLLKFIASCDKERDALRTDSPQFRQKTKYKISGIVHCQNKRKPVAVLDPETGRIVKIYSSIQTAFKVANSLFENNLKCEVHRDWISSLNKMRTFFMQSGTDLVRTLFGYRWVLLEDLRRGRVSFHGLSAVLKKSKKSMRSLNDAQEFKKMDSMRRYSQVEKDENTVTGLIKLTDGEKCYVFNSIEESLSFPGIQADIPSARKQLKSLAAKLDLTDSFGRIWRLLDETVQKENAAAFSESHSLHSEQNPEQNDASLQIVKTDIISDTQLLAFHSIGSAFQDWLYTLDSCIEEENDRTIESFCSQYLDGHRSVDGICWKTISHDKQPDFEAKPMSNGMQQPGCFEVCAESGDKQVVDDAEIHNGWH